MTSPRISAFADVAHRFCAFCETRCPLDNEDLVALAKLLASLHGAALELPDAFDEGDLAAEDTVEPLPPALWAAPLDRYWEVLDPLALDPDEPAAASLEEDVKGIYLDLKMGLAQYERGHAVAAAWSWRVSFWSHWGAHLVGAQRAVYFYFSALGSAEG